MAKSKGIKVCPVERKPRFLEFSNTNVERFDVVLLCNLLDRSLKPLQILDFCRKILKPNGVVIISISAPWRPAAKPKFRGSNHAHIIQEKKYDQGNYVCR